MEGSEQRHEHQAVLRSQVAEFLDKELSGDASFGPLFIDGRAHFHLASFGFRCAHSSELRVCSSNALFLVRFLLQGYVQDLQAGGFLRHRCTMAIAVLLGLGCRLWKGFLNRAKKCAIQVKPYVCKVHGLGSSTFFVFSGVEDDDPESWGCKGSILQ